MEIIIRKLKTYYGNLRLCTFVNFKKVYINMQRFHSKTPQESLRISDLFFFINSYLDVFVSREMFNSLLNIF